jgi:hypothetical protein
MKYSGGETTLKTGTEAGEQYCSQERSDSWRGFYFTGAKPSSSVNTGRLN